MLKGLKLNRGQLGKINPCRKLDRLSLVEITSLMKLHFLLEVHADCIHDQLLLDGLVLLSFFGKLTLIEVFVLRLAKELVGMITGADGSSRLMLLSSGKLGVP